MIKKHDKVSLLFLFEHQQHTFIFIKGDTVNVKKTKEMVKDQKDFISPYDKYR